MSEEITPNNVREIDASALKGLAHPLRMPIYDALTHHGPQTATSLAKRLGDGQFREFGEVGVRRDPITGEHPVPDRSAAYPGRTADGSGGERERAVGDS